MEQDRKCGRDRWCREVLQVRAETQKLSKISRKCEVNSPPENYGSFQVVKPHKSLSNQNNQQERLTRNPKKRILTWFCLKTTKCEDAEEEEFSVAKIQYNCLSGLTSNMFGINGNKKKESNDSPQPKMQGVAQERGPRRQERALEEDAFLEPWRCVLSQLWAHISGKHQPAAEEVG